MAKTGCVTKHRRWKGLRRRVMDGEASLYDKTQEVGRSEEESDGW